MKYLIALFISFLVPLELLACMCSGASYYGNNERTIEWWNESPYIFKAVLDSTQTKESEYQKLFLTTSKVYKGSVSQKITFYSPMFGSSCEWDLQESVGAEFIIYAKLDESGLITSHYCQGSKKLLTPEQIDSMDTYDFYKNILKQELKFITDIENSMNGIVSTYYSNGNLTGKGAFKDGKPIGKWQYYSFEGNIVSEGPYESGLKNGVWKEYLSPELYYDQSHGKSTNEKYWSGSFVNGVHDGAWSLFRKDGTVEKTVTFADGNAQYKD